MQIALCALCSVLPVEPVRAGKFYSPHARSLAFYVNKKQNASLCAGLAFYANKKQNASLCAGLAFYANKKQTKAGLGAAASHLCWPEQARYLRGITFPWGLRSPQQYSSLRVLFPCLGAAALSEA
jgi:hypothetical protein